MYRYTFLFLLLIVYGKLNSQNIVTEYKTGARVWEFENGFLISTFTNGKLLQLDKFYIKDCNTGKILYENNEGLIKDKNGKILYSMKNDTIRDYEYGNVVYRMEAEYLVEGSTNERLYKLEGIIPVEIVVAAILEGLR